MSVLLLVIGLASIIGLIVVHEAGHFLVARRNGVDIEEFGIFFPPKLYSRKTKGGWIFSINSIPLGGFVKLKGEHDSDTAPGTLGAASLRVKAKILLAGVSMNLLTGLVLFTILAAIGMPQLVQNQYNVKSNAKAISQRVIISDIVGGSQADKAGLQHGDQIISIGLPGNTHPTLVNDANKLPTITKSYAGEKVVIDYVRSGAEHTVNVSLLPLSEVLASQNTNNPKYELGVAPQQLNINRSTWSSPVVAVGLSTQLIGATIQGLGHSLAGLGSLVAGAVTGNNQARHNGQTAASANLTGPVGIFAILRTSSDLGFQVVLFFVAYISIILAFMNVLPIPIVDGGKLYISIIMRALKKPLTTKLEDTINLVSVIVLLGLFVLITIADVKRYY